MSTDAYDNADDQVDEQCDAFERAWRAGQRPKIAGFLSAANRAVRSKLFRELLLVELEYRRMSGELPQQREYLQEFPEFASQIEAVDLQYRHAAFAPQTSRQEGAVPAERLNPGNYVAHFRLIELLGEGAMGSAWKAWDSRLRRCVMLKLPRSHSMAENDLRRFLREGQSGAQLHHEQLVSVHDVGRDGDIFYLVAGYVEGDNLREFASRTQLTFTEIATLCAEIAEALQYVHAKGIVHRDLKPANIIIDPSGRPHIIDFGLAKLLDDDDDLTMHGELIGTPAYMSPEQAGGNTAQISSTSDIYSLGVILFELMTGDSLFEGDRESVIRQILSREPARPRSIKRAIPKDLETICLKAIEKRPALRYQTASEFSADLRSFASSMPILARRASALEKCGRLMRSRPTITAILAIAMVVLATSSFAISSLRRQNQRLKGFRPVYVTTIPDGARVVLVPVDPNNNEPSGDPAEIIRPSGTTPLTLDAKAGRYLIEAEIAGSDEPMFTEVYRTVGDVSKQSEASARANIKRELDAETCRLATITLKPLADVTRQMAKINIDEQSRKLNPLLPKELYVDVHQTLPNDGDSPNEELKTLLSETSSGEPCLTYKSADDWVERNHKRIASAVEYDAIAKAIELGQCSRPIEELSDDRPEYTTTVKADQATGGNAAKNHLREMHVLKGYSNSTSFPEMIRWVDGSLLAPHDCKSAVVGVRGVHSGTPRFLTPQ